MRTFGEMTGVPDLGTAIGLGVRANPTFKPTPNSEPAGYQTGAPPHTRLFSVKVNPVSKAVGSLIVPGTPENRIAILTSPLVGFRIYIAGGSGLNAQTALALPPGLAFDVPLPGLQEIYAISDAPVYLTLQVCISIVLASEQARRVG